MFRALYPVDPFLLAINLFAVDFACVGSIDVSWLTSPEWCLYFTCEACSDLCCPKLYGTGRITGSLGWPTGILLPS